jgi:two-component sensor histidine kinase
LAFIDPAIIPPLPHVALTLALAVVESSTAPLLLLDGVGTVIGVSDSFAETFELVPGEIVGRPIYALGGGEWNVPRLRSLLTATASGAARVPSYEIDLEMPGHGRRRLVLNAQRLDYDVSSVVRLLLAVADVTDSRAAEKVKDELLREKAMLMQEIQHRVANSLQIIASVLMTSARSVGNEESRHHLRDAHGRVMAIAELQKQLAESQLDDVDFGAYLDQLCISLGASMIDDPDRILLTAVADGTRVTANTSVSLGLVVTELVINSLKHAFPAGAKGWIRVDYAADAKGWQLKVCDNGIGMSGAVGAKPGLGTSIVNALTKHLDAVVAVTPGRPGTTVSIVHTHSAPAGMHADPLETAI